MPLNNKLPDFRQFRIDIEKQGRNPSPVQGGLNQQLPDFRQFKVDFQKKQSSIITQPSTLQQPTEQVIESPTSGEINASRKSFWSPSPKGITTRDVIREFFPAVGTTAKEIGQVIARGARLLPEASEKIKSGQVTRKDIEEIAFTAKTNFQKKIFGTDKEFSFKTEGGDLLTSFGVEDPEKIQKYSVPLGLFFVGLDYVPGTKAGKLTIEAASKVIAKTKNLKTIIKTLSKVIKGPKKEIKSLAESLTKVNNEVLIRKVINSAARQDVKAIKHTIPMVADETSEVVGKYRTVDDFVDNSMYVRRETASNLNSEQAGLKKLADDIIKQSDEYQQIIKKRNSILSARSPDYSITSKLLKQADNLEKKIFKDFYEKNVKKAVDEAIPKPKAGLIDEPIERIKVKKVAPEKAGKIIVKKTKEVPGKGATIIKTTVRDIAKPKKEAVKTTIRRTTGQIKPKSLIAFNKRMKELSIVSKTSARSAEKRIRDAQKEAVSMIRENLPISQRGKFMGVVTDIRDFRDLKEAGRMIKEGIEENAIEEAMKLVKSDKRKKVSFLRKLADLNQVGINEAKKLAGIDGPVYKATNEQLDSLLKELKKKYKYKREKGYAPKIVSKSKKPKPMAKEMIIANREIQKQTIHKPFLTKTSKAKNAISEYVGKYLTPISTQLENINPKLKYALRRFELKSKSAIRKDIEKIEPWWNKARPSKKIKATATTKKVKGGGALSVDDYLDLDFYMKNGNIRGINKIVKKYKLEKEYKGYRQAMDDLFKRAKEVGFSATYQKHYAPRNITDLDGLIEYLRGVKGWNEAELSYFAKEMQLGRALDADEKADILNSYIRGYGSRTKQIPITETGYMKTRTIDHIDPEMNKFFAKTNDTLPEYMTILNDQIELRKFFGKYGIGTEKKISGKYGEKVINKKGKFIKVDPEDSIGEYTNQLLFKGEIDQKDVTKLREILSARFNEKGVDQMLGVFKNLTYISVMGSPYNAVTQIGDLTFSIYAGGLARTLKQIPLSILRKTKISRDELGFQKLAVEFSNTGFTSKAVDTVFKAVGLHGVDAIGKEALINSTLGKFMKYARFTLKKQQKLKGKAGRDYRKFRTKLDNIFGDEADEVLKNLKDDNITENVKLLIFNEVLDFQPLALSEVPQKYLTSGNGRILYMLKTWSIKMMDVWRRETLREIKKGYQLGDKNMVIDGMRNMVKLATIMTISEAASDSIKDLMLGRPIDLTDSTIDNFLKLILLNRYTLSVGAQEGIGHSLMTSFLPSTDIIDSFGTDLWDSFKDSDESFDVNNLRSIKNIPFIGKLWYWWIGRAADYKEKEAKKKQGDFYIGGKKVKKTTAPSTKKPSKNDYYIKGIKVKKK